MAGHSTQVPQPGVAGDPHHTPTTPKQTPAASPNQKRREQHTPHPHARAHSTWIADPNSPPSGRAVRGGGAPDPRRPSQQWKAPPPGTPFRHPHNPKPSRGEPGPDRPPPSTPDGARDRGRTRGGARTTWNSLTSAQCRDRARCARHTTQEGGERTPRERERTHTQRARGHYQKGNRTEHAEGTDRVEWRTSERGSGTPRRDGPPHEARDTWGGKGETRETQHQVPARTPRTGRERRAHTDGALHPPRQ